VSAEKSIGASRTVAQDMVHRVQRAWGESPFYQAQLKGPAPDRLCFQPVDRRTPDKTLGQSVLKGRLTIGTETIDCEGELDRVWSIAGSAGLLHDFLHQFIWLRHTAALGENANPKIRSMARAWFDLNEKWSQDAWRPFTTGERVIQLCCHGSTLMSGGDAMWRSRVLTSMARQTRHLARSGHRAETGYERLMTATAMTIAGLCLAECDGAIERGVELLRRELRLQIRPDGGHVSRNPSKQINIVLRLQMVLQAMEARRVQAPGFLRHMVGKTAAHAQLFRVGDGRLAVFNGGYEDDARAVLAAGEVLDADAAPTCFARHSGFQRLDAARAAVIADIGAAHGAQRGFARAGSASDQFQGAGSFHFSSGRSRIVVNCGAGAHLPGEWGAALRQPAAHSRLLIEPPSAAAGLLSRGPVSHRRAEDGRGQLLEIDRTLGEEGAAAHYFRRLFLSSGGDNLRGEDRFVAAPLSLVQNWVIRFHLHPAVRASLARDGKSMIMLLPNKEGWRFRTNCRDIKIEKSTYCGDGGVPVATEQIVLRAPDLEQHESGDMVVKWGFRRLDGV